MYDVKQSICYPGFGVRSNEDAIGYGKNYCFVIDGASCLSGRNIVDPISDAAWMVRNIRDHLCSSLDVDDPRPTRELLRQIIAQVRKEHTQVLHHKNIVMPEDSPSASFAMFRQRNNNLGFFGLGDCVGVAKLPGGSFFSSLEHNLPDLDHPVLNEMVRLHHETGISVREAKTACTDLLLHNRNLRNKSGGYWILDLLTDDGINHAREISWPLTSSVCVGAFSDGFAQLVEVFGNYPDYNVLFDAMQKNNLEQMFQHLCAMQDADPDYNNYPRFKHRDDTCALWGIFSPDK